MNQPSERDRERAERWSKENFGEPTIEWFADELAFELAAERERCAKLLDLRWPTAAGVVRARGAE